MNYGVVLPIWQLTVAQAESLAARAEQLGLDGVFVPDHILTKPATTQHYVGHWPAPLSVIAHSAGRTHRLRLAVRVAVMSNRVALLGLTSRCLGPPASLGGLHSASGVCGAD